MLHVVAAVLAAMNARDLEAFVACYAPDAAIEDGDGTTLARGHAGIRARYGPMFDTLPQLAVRADSRIEVGEHVVEEEVVTGRSSRPERHVAGYRIRDGLIVHERLLR